MVCTSDQFNYLALWPPLVNESLITQRIHNNRLKIHANSRYSHLLLIIIIILFYSATDWLLFAVYSNNSSLYLRALENRECNYSWRLRLMILVRRRIKSSGLGEPSQNQYESLHSASAFTALKWAYYREHYRPTTCTWAYIYRCVIYISGRHTTAARYINLCAFREVKFLKCPAKAEFNSFSVVV